MNVAVCVTTYRRPDGLSRLLRSLHAQTFSGTRPALQLVVVDNDAAGGSRDVCVESAPRDDWPRTYAIEPRRGIPYGRNTALAHVRADMEFVAFIDDDEVAAPDWLDRLLAAQQRFQADVVAGPVTPVFAEGTPAWVIRGGFFQRPRYRSGQPLNVAYTCNVLVRRDILRDMAGPFDTRFGLSGGEDSHLFRRLAQAGYRLVWEDAAMVQESIPRSRSTVGWLLRRALRTANSMALIEVDLSRSPLRRPRIVVKGLAWMLLGLLLTPGGLLLGRHRSVQGGRYFCYGLGLLLGLCGMRYEEYRRTHGS
jgi:glycosyltransferase involved in cell wall biosynthesis